jgi:hypothetical protein
MFKVVTSIYSSAELNHLEYNQRWTIGAIGRGVTLDWTLFSLMSAVCSTCFRPAWKLLQHPHMSDKKNKNRFHKKILFLTFEPGQIRGNHQVCNPDAIRIVQNKLLPSYLFLHF